MKPNPTQPKPPTQIRLLLNKYAISLQDLKNCMSEEVKFSSRSTLHRLVTGTLSDEMSQQLRPIAARCLKRFLHARGLVKPEIDAELTAIFNEGEYQTMSCQRIKLSYDELQFFGLPRDPFFYSPDSKDEVYFPPAYREVFDTIIDAVKYRHFIAVLGPVGSSKSTVQDLLRDHIARVDKNLKIVWPEFYNQANLTPSEIARSILRSLGVERIPQRATALAQALTDELRRLTHEGIAVAMVVDNCHELNKAAIRSFKKFLEMSSGGFQRYLGIVLMGWPQFESTLREADFSEIYERLHVVPMPPWVPSDMSGVYATDPKVSIPLMTGYMAKRFENIGHDIADFFDEDALQFVAENAETPLQCGNIANKALRTARTEYDEKKVTGAAIRKKMFFESRSTSSPAFRKR